MSRRDRKPHRKPASRPKGDGKPVVRMTTPAQMVASVPLQIGYVPAESVVVMCCHEPRGRMGLMMRYDLPEPRYEAEIVKDIERRVRAQNSTRVVLFIYTAESDTSQAEGAELARAALMKRLTDAFADLVVTEALLVRDGRFFNYVCRNDECCPLEGTPVDAAAECSSVRILEAERVMNGRVMMPDRAALEQSVAAPTFLARELALQRLEDAELLLLDRLDLLGRSKAVETALASWIDAIARFNTPPWDLNPHEAASLATCLQLVEVRDRIAATRPSEVPGLLVLLEELCRRTPAPHDAPLCTLLGWVTYAEGGGTITTIALERALATDAGYTMANLLMSALQGGLPASFAREVTHQLDDHFVEQDRLRDAG
jgi:hypothetical protein